MDINLPFFRFYYVVQHSYTTRERGSFSSSRRPRVSLTSITTSCNPGIAFRSIAA